MFSFEMRRLQLECRMLSALSGVNHDAIESGIMSAYDFERAGKALASFETLPIWIDDQAGQTVWNIRAACRRMKAEHGLGLVIIDYIQLMPGSLERKGANRNEELTDISRRLKVLADELNVPILVLSQLNRGSAKDAGREPVISDLRESGALEQDADIVTLLHRKDHRTGGPTKVIFAKRRNGPPGAVYLNLEPELCRFVDPIEGTPEPKEEPAPVPARKERSIASRYRQRASS
jgi:replicative DNA helicase